MSILVIVCVLVLVVALAILISCATRSSRTYVGGVGQRSDVIHDSKAQAAWNTAINAIESNIGSQKIAILPTDGDGKNAIANALNDEIEKIITEIHKLENSEAAAHIDNQVNGPINNTLRASYIYQVDEYVARLKNVSNLLLDLYVVQLINRIKKYHNNVPSTYSLTDGMKDALNINKAFSKLQRQLRTKINRFVVESNILRPMRLIVAPAAIAPAAQPLVAPAIVSAPAAAPASQPSVAQVVQQAVQPIVQAAQQAVQNVVNVVAPAAPAKIIELSSEPIAKPASESIEQTSTPTWEKLNFVLHSNEELLSDKVKFVIMHRLKHRYPKWTRVDLNVITKENAEHIGDGAVQRKLDTTLGAIMDERHVGAVDRPTIARFMKLYLASAESSIVRRVITAGEINHIEEVFARLYAE